jgi:hypothetical protein
MDLGCILVTRLSLPCLASGLIDLFLIFVHWPDPIGGKDWMSGIQVLMLVARCSRRTPKPAISFSSGIQILMPVAPNLTSVAKFCTR